MARSAGTHAQGVRLIRLLQRLQGRASGIELVELQAEMQVSRSQLRRDLLALEEAGMRLAIEQEHGRYGRARVRLLDAESAAIPASLLERYALLAARGVFELFRGSPLHKDMDALFAKVMDTMPVETRRDTRAMATRIHVRPSGGTKSYVGFEEIVNALTTGLLKERLVRFRYQQRSGRSSAGVMAPYAMVIHRNGLYVVAQRVQDAEGNDVRQEPRQFAVERFAEAAWIRRSHFQFPADFNIEDYFDDAFGLITGRKRHHVIVDLSKRVRTDANARQLAPHPDPHAATRRRRAHRIRCL